MAAKRQISYIKPSEPSFLTKFKEDVGFKEGPTVDTKKEAPPSLDDLADRPDTDEEKPVVVVLKEGDLTQEEVDQVQQETRLKGGDEEEDKDDGETGDGRIVFRKPTKRSQNEASDLNTSSSKKKKGDKKKDKKSSTAKKVKNSSLLSFGDDEEEEDTR